MSTPASVPRVQSQERPVRAFSGWLVLVINVALYAATVWALVAGAMAANNHAPDGGWFFLASGVCAVT